MFQQRGQYGNPVDYFVRSMSEYVEGFGNPSKEFWLGLDKLVSLTKNGNTELMIELETFEVRAKTTLKNKPSSFTIFY